MSAVSGDFAALNSMLRKIEAVAGSGPEASAFKQGLLTQCAEGARSMLDEGFIKSIDPYGNPWAPLKLRQGKPLQDTGRLASGYTYRITDDGFAIETNTAYAGTHQRGATIVPVTAKQLAFKVRGGGWHFARKVTVPKRQMVPEAATGGIGTWGAAINEEADAFVNDWFRKAK